jgi:hypothetical protein
MARIRVARGSRTNLPGALDENTLLYGEMYWEREQAGVSDGVLYMGKPDGVADGEHDKAPLAIAGSRAMRSLYFQGLWNPSTGLYPANAQVGDIYVAEADGTGPASTFKYGDWAVCIGHDGETSNWLKAINQAITTEDPLGHDRNPLSLNHGVLKLKYDPATLKLNANGELTVSHTEVYTTESEVHIEAGQPVALNSAGKAIVADCADVDTAIVIGLAATTAEPGDFVTVQRADLVNVPYEAPSMGFEEVGAPVYLYLNGTFTQDVEQILPGFVLQQVGIATAADTVDVHIGTPFQIDASSDIYYIPLTQIITPGDSVHAPSAAAVHQIVQQLTNIEAEVVTKTDAGTQYIAGSLELAGDLTAKDIHVSADSIYIGDTKLSSDNGQLRVVNQRLPGEPVAIDVIDKARLVKLDTDIIPLNNDFSIGSESKRYQSAYVSQVNIAGKILEVAAGKVLLNNAEIVTTANQGTVVASLIPAANLDLGSSVNPFRNAFVSNELTLGSSKLSGTINGDLQIGSDIAITDQRLLDLNQNIVPTANNQYNLGSDTKRFASIYAEDIYVGASSLYVNGKKVIEDVSNVMEFKTSTNQTLALRTQSTVPGSGAANLEISAGNKVDILGTGGIDLTVPATANGKNILLSTQSSGGSIQLHGPVTAVNGLTVGGNLTVQGDITQVNTTQVNLADNIIVINSNQTGNPPSTLVSGIEVKRGDQPNYRFVFEELTKTFRIGENGTLQPVATRKDDMGVNNNVPVWNTALSQFQNTSVTISGSTITGTLVGNASTASEALKLTNARTISLTGNATGSASFDGGANASIAVTVTNNSHTHTSANISDATDANTANMVVRRNASGNFSAGTITAALSGNASTATKLQTERTISLTGNATGSATFDGSANASIAVTVTNNSHTHTSANISDATNASTANMIVRRDASGNFSAGTITAALAGNASSATTANQVRGVNFHTGTTDPTGTTRLNMDGYLHATRVYNAVWNDIADFIEVPQTTIIEYGKVFVMDEEGNYGASRNYCPAGIMGIASDTYGFGVGQKQDMKQIPIAIGGFVLAHIDKQYAPGTPLTATEDGKLTEIKITDKRDYPERIVATYWKPEPNAHWNGVLVNGRHWVKVK